MSSQGLPTTATSPNQSHPILDPLAFDNVRGLAGTQSVIGGGADEAEEDNGDGAVRRARRGPTGVDVTNIPPVKDTTGEMVMESFGLFLEKCVIIRCRSHGKEKITSTNRGKASRTRLLSPTHHAQMPMLSLRPRARADTTSRRSTT